LPPPRRERDALQGVYSTGRAYPFAQIHAASRESGPREAAHRKAESVSGCAQSRFTSFARKIPMHDLVIENASLIDGLRPPARAGDLAVQDGRSAAIGKDLGAARSRIDAQGLTLAPGIIDLHTHYDAQLLWD